MVNYKNKMSKKIAKFSRNRFWDNHMLFLFDSWCWLGETDVVTKEDYDIFMEEARNCCLEIVNSMIYYRDFEYECRMYDTVGDKNRIKKYI